MAQLATNFPEDLDNLTNPASTDSLQGHAQQHADVNDAIEAIQAKIGVDGSTDANSLDYRVSALETAPPSTEAKIIYETVKNATGSSIAKGKAVYISGSSGASGHMEISLASNAAELSSSKTFGLTRELIADGEVGEVVTEGLLQGINTVGANDGDPVWLGTSGSFIFGLANKPSAPDHLVFLGIVIRGGHSNTGSIFVKIQNGFELNELHDVEIGYGSDPSDGDVLSFDSASGTWKNTSGFATEDYVDVAVASATSSSDAITTLLGLEGNNDVTIAGIENKTVVDSFSSSLYKTIEYRIQITRNADIYASKMFLVNDGINLNLSETDIVSNTNDDLATITFEENSGIISLCVTPVSSAVMVRFYRTALKA